MQFYTEQVQGPHKQAITDALTAYREGACSQAATWGALSALYITCRRQPAPKWADHVTRGKAHIDNMLVSFFPHYANLWDSGTSRGCLEGRIRRLPGAILGIPSYGKPVTYIVYGDY